MLYICSTLKDKSLGEFINHTICVHQLRPIEFIRQIKGVYGFSLRSGSQLVLLLSEIPLRVFVLSCLYV